LAIVTFNTFAVLPCLITSCGSHDDSLPLSSKIESETSSDTANAILSKARAHESSGNSGKALDLYQDISKKYPLTDAADEARYAEAKILDQQGELLKAFEAYQNLIINHPGSRHYATALQRQKYVALAAANGIIKNNFLGMKTKIGPGRTTKMLANVRDNAPQAPSASEAQYTIGRVWQKDGNAQKALDAYLRISADYPYSSYAPEAQYQRGQILMLKAAKGNQNRAHLNQAKEIFLDLIDRYPNHQRSSDARKKLSNLASQDIQRSYDTAEFYRKKGNRESAIFYYKEVTQKSKSGSLHDRAKKRISELSE
jgi:outer membrane protein assembly factor BamD (BamD/ComL family)